MSTPGIILIEGADAAGKSTLARHLVEKHGARYLHSTVRREIWPWHVGALRLAARHVRAGRLVVLDRHWISELVYGHVFRGGPAYDVGARCLDRVLRRFGAVTVLCAPRDQQRQLARWEAGRAAGKHEHFNRVREVIQLYADLRDGNLARPGDGYLDQLIRFQDYTDRDDVMVYDLDDHGRALGGFAKLVLNRLEVLHDPWLNEPGENVSGRPCRYGRVSTLFVGEATSPAAGRYASPQWPWCDDDRRLSSATWFNRAVHHLALREDRLFFTNAVSPDDRLPKLIERNPTARVVALGRTAEFRLRSIGASFAAVEHPQHHRRFHHGEQPTGYAEILRRWAA